MLFLFQIIFCSKQILDHNEPLDLRINISSTPRAYENKDFCENVGMQQKSQEATKAVDKYLDVNQSDSNLLTYFTGKDLKSRCKDVDYDLCNFSSLITEENNLMPPSCTRSTVIKYVSKKHHCASEESRNDTKRLKASNILENHTMEHSQIGTSRNDNKNLLLHKNQNDLIQEQYVTSENNAFLQKNNNVLVLSKNQNYYLKTNGINELNDVQTDALFNFNNVLLKNTSEGSYSFNNSYKNDNNEKDKGTKPKIIILSNIQTNGNDFTLKSKRKIKTSRITLKSQFTASERELYKKYQRSEKNFKNFCKLKFGTRMPQLINQLEISNLSDELKRKSIFALKNLLSFLKTISEIYINTKKKKNKKEFLNLLNLAFNQFSGYAGVSQKLLTFKSICKSIHKVGVGFCRMSCCDFYEVNRLLSSMHRRFSFLYIRLLKLKNSIEKKINQQ